MQPSIKIIGNDNETLTIGDIYLNTKPHYNVCLCVFQKSSFMEQYLMMRSSYVQIRAETDVNHTLYEHTHTHTHTPLTL